MTISGHPETATAPQAPQPTTLSVPMLIDGKRASARQTQRVITESGANAIMPAFTAEVKDRLLSLDRNLLVGTSTQAIVSFLNRVGRNWRSEDYSRRRLYIRQLQQVLGYSEAAAEHEADWIGVVLTSHARMLDLIGIELGNRFLLDEWTRVDEALVRAYPLGLAVHILPGNVPSSTLLSMLRAVLTKNLSVLKVASGDPITATALVLSFMEVDPEHPVSRAVNVVYWPEGDPLGTEIVRSADAVCAWGSGPAITWAKEHTHPEASFLPFGPKRSVALVGPGADLIATARGLAHDISVYDQAACFSMQRVFVQGPVGPLVEELKKALEHYEELLPPQFLGVDDLAALNAQRLEYVFEGGQDHTVGERSAVIVVDPDVSIAPPLRRTILLHPVKDLREAYPYVDAGVQTVGAAPWDLLTEHRDQLALRGANRFVELGLSNVFRVGGAHDGMRPMQRLVRYASQEAPASEIPKGMVLPLDQTKILENKSFQDVIL